jgi:DNA-binding response OmpR family regulator
MNRILVVDDDRTTRHFLSRILKSAGHAVSTASDGTLALRKLRRQNFDLILLDIWMPEMNGLELLSHVPDQPSPPKVIIMTSDDTPETMLGTIRRRAYRYVVKPVHPEELLDYVSAALTAPATVPPIEVISARPAWVELLVPCTLEAADRIQSFLSRLDSDLSEDVREAVGRVFRELLLNAIEWGGQFDPERTVRISYLRARRLVLYRVADPGPGFCFGELAHAAAGQAPGDPTAHLRVREEKGIRPGGFGILMARAMVDEVIYNEKQNEVVFIKYLD